MKPLLVSHSNINHRQRMLGVALSRLCETVVAAPKKWLHEDFKAVEKPPVNYREYPLDVNTEGDLARYSFPQLWDMTLHERPSIIYYQGEAWSQQGVQCVAIARLLRVPIVFFVWENIERRYPYPLDYFYQFNLENMSAAICGNSIAKSFIDKLAPHCPTYSLPQTGIDLNVFQSCDCGGGYGSEGDVLFMSRLVPEKGVLVLLSALPYIYEKLPDLRIGIIGKGSMESDVVNARKVYPNITYYNYVEWGHHLAHIMKKYKIFLSLSVDTPQWKEQGGYAPLEALSLGLHVISTPAGSFPEWLKDQVYWIPMNDSTVLTEAIVNTIGKTYNGKGVAFVKDNYSVDVIAKKLFDLLSDIEVSFASGSN